MSGDGGFGIRRKTKLMLNLLDCWMACEFGRKGEKGEWRLSTFGEGFTGFSNDIYSSAFVKKTAQLGRTLDTFNPFRQLVETRVHSQSFDTLGPG
jgi:hypothetical protein